MLTGGPGAKSLLKPPSASSLLNAGTVGGSFMAPGMAGLDDDDISIVDEVKGTLPRPPALTKAPLAALSRGGYGATPSYPGGFPPGLLPSAAGGSMQV